MPTYEYLCRKCGHTFEEFQSMSEEPLTRCPECSTDNLARVMGGGGGFILKGSGFYGTDYKKRQPNGEGDSGKKEAGKPEAGKKQTEVKEGEKNEKGEKETGKKEPEKKEKKGKKEPEKKDGGKESPGSQPSSPPPPSGPPEKKG